MADRGHHARSVIGRVDIPGRRRGRARRRVGTGGLDLHRAAVEAFARELRGSALRGIVTVENTHEGLVHRISPANH